MKIFISISATPAWSKGQRVLVKIAQGEWYAATVTAVRATGVSCTADDGDKIKFDADSTARNVKVLQNLPVRKRTLTDAQVKDLVEKDKALVAKEKEKLKVPPKTPPKVVPKTPRPTPKRDPIVTEKPEPRPTPRHKPDAPQTKSVGVRPSYAGLSYESSSHDMLAYLQKMWTWANGKYFGGGLPKASAIRLQRDTDVARMKRRAAWFPRTRVLSFHPRLFNAPEDKMLEIFVHEMCHQAVTDLDRVHDRTAGGHGPNWRAWMVKCGLDPNRYDADKNDKYMDEFERSRIEAKQQRKQEHQQQLGQEMRRFFWSGTPTPVCYSDGNGLVHGLAAALADQKGTRIAVVLTPHSSSFMKVPSSWLYEIPQSDPNYIRVSSPSFMDAAQRVVAHKDGQKHRREMRKLVRNLYG